MQTDKNFISKDNRFLFIVTIINCLFLFPFACSTLSSQKDYNLRTTHSGQWQTKLFQKLELKKMAGLSGLTQLKKGTYISVAERDQALLILRLKETQTNIELERISVAGFPKDLDMEAIVAISPKEVWIGTESRQADRKHDFIFKIDISKNPAQIVGRIEFPYEQFKNAPSTIDRSNRGIEGLCLSSEYLYVATESPRILDSGERMAMLSRYHLATQQWTPFYARLNSQRGKTSALSCQRTDSANEPEIYAIERHYGVSQIIRLEPPVELEPETILETKPILNLDPFFKNNPNLEGLVSLSPFHFIVLSDNQSSVIQGPTVFLELVRKP